MRIRWDNVIAYLVVAGVLHITSRMTGLPVVGEVALLFVGCVAVQAMVGGEWVR